MNRKCRTTILVLALWSVFIGIPGYFLWREVHQQQLNQQLVAAIKSEDTSAALLTLNLGADANARDEPRVSVWQRMWNLLQHHRTAPSTANTPLLILLDHVHSRDHPDLVRALLAHGARVDDADELGLTPLYKALSTRKTASALLLIEHGADVTPEARNQSAVTDMLKRRVLITAIEHSSTAAVVESLLRHGADPNQAGLEGLTVLGMAVLYGDPPTVQCLLRHRADPNRTAEFFRDDSIRPLEYAEKHHMTEIARMLKNAGAHK